MDFKSSMLPPFSLLPEPALSFNSENTALEVNPLRGLIRFGAYNSASFAGYTPELRVAIVGPARGWPRLGELVNTIRSSHKPSDRANYVPHFPGFEKLFRVPIVSARKDVHIKWPDDLMALGDIGSPHQRLLAAMTQAMIRLSAVRDEFDVVMLHLPDDWEVAFTASGFDAHDALKALGAQYGIPTQVINDRSFEFKYKASIAWRLAIALFVKAGGVPWKLAPMERVPENTAYIGLAYALRGDPRDAQFVTCCSQVFDADGGGMQFVAFEARDPIADVYEARRNPFLSRSDMRAVMARSLDLYLKRNAGELPRRLVIHKTTAFREEELKGVFDALSTVKEVECLEIGSRGKWRGVWMVAGRRRGVHSEADNAPVPRGAMLLQSGTSALVWVAGNAPTASMGKPLYFQGGKSIPNAFKPSSAFRQRATRDCGSRDCCVD